LVRQQKLRNQLNFKKNNMLPKFLLADNSQVLPDKIFVIHNEQPRFIVGCDVEGFTIDQEIYWIDEEPASEELKSELLEQAEEFMDLELEYEEELYLLENEEEAEDNKEKPK